MSSCGLGSLFQIGLASLPSPETFFVHWVDWYERCPACGADLQVYAQATALVAKELCDEG